MILSSASSNRCKWHVCNGKSLKQLCLFSLKQECGKKSTWCNNSLHLERSGIFCQKNCLSGCCRKKIVLIHRGSHPIDFYRILVGCLYNPIAFLCLFLKTSLLSFYPLCQL